jgi:protein-S-isoprenylcysteine O-methyltransferase Ste14
VKDHTTASNRDVLSAAAMLAALPPLTYYLRICVDEFQGALVTPTADLLRRIPAPTLAALAIYGCWFGFQAAAYVLMPGKVYEGEPLSDGTRLKYKSNGWRCFWLTLAAFSLAIASGWIPATILYDNFGPLLTTANFFVFLFAGLLYVIGKRSARTERRTGNALVDYVMGTSLNPRLGGFDMKFFCEGRPGLIFWVLLNVSFAAKQYGLHGQVTTPMLLVVAFQLLYVADYFFHEEAILTTWDIKHENFGWMLCWGCLVWVPFTYTLQAQYLVHHPHELPIPAVVGLVVLNMAGFAIFRGANIQKHRFRKNPERLIWGKPPQYITTSRGALLLTSGWWGVARHSNYLGDLLMALAWCLTAGFAHVLPYFYFIYFAILLIHRDRRDNATCRNKYGKDWDSYCRKVRWRIVPGIY